MDLFKQKYVVESLTMLIEDSLNRSLIKENAEEQLDIARCALQTAQRLDYFPEKELARLKGLYPLMVAVPIHN